MKILNFIGRIYRKCLRIAKKSYNFFWTKKVKPLSTEYYLFRLKIYSKKMKLGVAYNLFDGEELLESSIKAIRSEVDFICVLYQDISYTGQKQKKDIKPMLDSLVKKGFVDKIYYFHTNLTAQKCEIAKRDMGLNLAKKAGCTRFISMDVDEYYKKEEFKFAKEYIFQNNIHTSAVKIIEYLLDPTYQMINSFTINHNKDFYTFFAPFIIKIYKIKKQKHGIGYYPCATDPTRFINGKAKFYLFPAHRISMHHMSTIRKDLDKKYNNSNFMNTTDEVKNFIKEIQKEISAFNFVKNKSKLHDYSIFNNTIIRIVENYFEISI